MSTEDKIIHALHAINTTMAQSAMAPSDMQLNAINTLRTILQDYQRHPAVNDAPPGQRETHSNTSRQTKRSTAAPSNSSRGATESINSRGAGASSPPGPTSWT
jgi:hypothetical protein